MRHSDIGTVMTPDVIRVRRETPFKEVVRLLAQHRISGMPVVDDEEKVIGVVSESDVIERQAGAADGSGGHRRSLPRLGRAARRAAAKSKARTAGDLMSAPAVTVGRHDSIVTAARTMTGHHVKRLPVVDETGRLVGIVTRHDLLRVFLRPDEEIRAEVIEEVLVRTLWLPPDAVTVSVRSGVVELSGKVERRSEIPIIVRLVSRVDGVVAVVDRLAYEWEDTRVVPLEQSLRTLAGERLRRL